MEQKECRRQTRKYILEGGGGTGKSTLLNEIAKTGIYTLGEVAEYLIQRGITPASVGREDFQEKVLDIQLEWEREIPLEKKYSFQDRGIPGGIGFFLAEGLEPPEKLLMAARKAEYAGIFLLEPLATYENTAIRAEKREKALLVHQKIREAYESLGYELHVIPDLPLGERMHTVMDRWFANELLLNSGLQGLFKRNGGRT
ncbi:MAG: ATP-binding protein [Nanoarchaeota archaeon]|nr:ATP-binding protein [Nanoarchaeota archaeon]